MTTITAPLQAQIVEWLFEPGQSLRAGDVLVVLEAMKMEHEVRAPIDGRLVERFFEARETVQQGESLARLEALAAPEDTAATESRSRSEERRVGKECA